MTFGVAVGVIVIDRNYDIHSINGEARRLFGIHSTALERDLIHQVQYFDATQIRQAVDQALAEKVPRSVLLPSLDAPAEARRMLDITATPTERSDEEAEIFVVITVVDRTERERLRERQAGATLILDRLTQANEEVLMANQELTTTIAKLRAENEEMQVAWEEIQAATEEVETLNEELQASNEELETLNEEMQATVEELNTTNDDLHSRTLELQAMALEGETARQRLQSVLEALTDPIGLFDHAGGLVLWNAAWDEVGLPASFDLSAVDIEGNPVPASAWPPAHAKRNQPLNLTVGIDRPGQQRRWLTIQGNPVVTEARERLLVVTIEPASDPTTAP